MSGMSIGELTFGVNANTSPMLRSLKDIQKYRSAVTRTAKHNKTATESEITSMVKREVAMRRAMRTALDMQATQNKSMKEGKGLENANLRVANSLQRYIKELRNSKTSTLEFNRATQGFKEKMDLARESVRKLNTETRKGKLGKMTNTLRQLESASVLAIGPLSGLGARIRSLGAIASRTSSIMTIVFIGALTALTVAFWKMSAAAINAAKIWEASMARFKAATGTMELAKKEMKFVMDTSIKLGLRIQDTAKAYSRLTAASKGSAFAGAATRKIFLSVAQAAAALRLTQGEVEGAFRAIEQIMSKGTVQAEELRGQLGERLPGAFRIAAESMGMTTIALGKLLKTGQLTAEKFLPAFAEGISKSFGPDALSNIDSYTGSMNNLANAGFIFAKKWDLATGTSKLLTLAIQSATWALNGLGNIIAPTIKLIASLTLAMATAVYGMKALTLAWVGMKAVYMGTIALGNGLIAMYGALRVGTLGAAAATWILNGALYALMANPFGGLIAIIVKAVAAIVVFIGTWKFLSWVMGDYEAEVAAATLETEKATAAIKALSDGAETQKVKKMTKDIEDFAAGMKAMKDAAAWSDNGRDMELYFKSFMQQYEAASLETEEFKRRAEALGVVLGTNLEDNIQKVGVAMFRLAESHRVTKEAFDASVNSIEALKDTYFELSVAQERLSASKGVGGAEKFDAVGAKVLEYQREMKLSLDANIITQMEYTRRTQQMTNALRELYEINQAIDKADEAKKEREKAKETAAKNVIKSQEALVLIQKKLDAAMKGEAALAYYENVTMAVDKQAKILDKANVSETERARVLRETEAAAIGLYGMELALAQARKNAAAETAKANQIERSRAKAMEDALQKMEVIRERITQASKGPMAASHFEKVDKQVLLMTQRLIEQGWEQTEINNLTKEYIMLLEKQYQIQGPIGQAATSMANAFGNSLEAIIMKTESVKSALKGLLRELMRVAARAMFIDPLVSALSGSLTGAFTSGLTSSAAGGGMPSSGYSSWGGGLAKGGPVAPGSTYTVGEEGPEILRMGSQGGHITPNGSQGVSVTINAPGADAGTIARVKEMINTEMVPQIIRASTQNTINYIRRPKFA